MAACGHPVRDVDKYAVGESSMQIYANSYDDDDDDKI
jgi:hypothetical protein